MLIEYTGCCAVSEMDGISNYKGAEDAMFDFCEELMLESGNPDKAVGGHYIFTAVTQNKSGKQFRYGQNFAAFIKRHGLGTVCQSAPAPNRLNTKNIVVVWVWQPNPDRLQKWYQNELRKQEGKDK